MDAAGSIVSCLPLPVLVVNENLEVLHGSRPAFALFCPGQFPTPEDHLTRALTESLHAKADLTGLINAVTLRLTRPGVVEHFRWNFKERSFDVTVSALPVANGGRFDIVFDEKTDQLVMERDSARVRGYLESIMASLQLGVIVVNRELQITNINRTQEAFLKITGIQISLLQAIGMPIAELFPEEAELLGTVASEVLNQGTVYGGIAERLHDESGKEIVLAVSFSPLRGEKEEIVGMIRVCEDVTEKQRLEENLRKAELRASEIETIRKVIVTLNHEVNNALMGIMGNIQIMQRLWSFLKPDQKAMLNTMMKESEKIAAVTHRLASMEEAKTVDYLDDGPKMFDMR